MRCVCVSLSGCVRGASGAVGDGAARAQPLSEARVRVREAGGGRDVPHAAGRARRARAARRAPPLAPAARLAAGRARPRECLLRPP